MSGAERISATALAQEVGITQPTLSRWLREARSVPTMNSQHDQESLHPRPRSPQSWTVDERFAAVLEAATVPAAKLGEFLRSKGLHAEQLKAWQDAARSALGNADSKRQRGKAAAREAQRIRELERDLRSKEKALAEVTALLVLKKKVALLWGDADAGTPTRNGT